MGGVAHPTPQYFQIYKIVGQKLARQQEGWPQYFVTFFLFRKTNWSGRSFHPTEGVSAHYCVGLLVKLKKSPFCLQIRPQRSLSAESKHGLILSTSCITQTMSKWVLNHWEPFQQDTNCNGHTSKASTDSALDMDKLLPRCTPEGTVTTQDPTVVNCKHRNMMASNSASF